MCRKKKLVKNRYLKILQEEDTSFIRLMHANILFSIFLFTDFSMSEKNEGFELIKNKKRKHNMLV